MRARLTFLGKVEWSHGNYMAWNAHVQGCPERAGHTLVFKPEFALYEGSFQGTLEWLSEPKGQGLESGTKFSYIIPLTNQVVAKGEVL